MVKKIYINFLICFLFFSSNSSYANEKLIKSIDEKINQLGEYSEVQNYPVGFFDVVAKACEKKKNFGCIKAEVPKKMSLMFNSGELYNQRNPENQLYAMAMFEIFYLNNLKKNERNLEKFKADWPTEKNSFGKYALSLIKLNETRKKMREAVGLNLSNTPEQAINAYWSLGSFLAKGKINKNKITKDYVIRKELLSEYNGPISKLKAAIENQELEEIYEYLK